MKFYFTAINSSTGKIEEKDFSIEAFDEDGVEIGLTKTTESISDTYAILRLNKYSATLECTWLDILDPIFSYLKSTNVDFSNSSVTVEVSNGYKFVLSDLKGINSSYDSSKIDVPESTEKIYRENFTLEFLK